MKGEEKERKFHEALLKMLYPPPPTSPPRHDDDEEEEKKLIKSSNDPPEEQDNEEQYSSLSRGDENEGENGGTKKLTRAKRKRLRKRKLKEDAFRREKIIGPLLPSSSDDKNYGGLEVVGNVLEGVRQNAATDVSGDPASCSKRNKLRKRRNSKNLRGKS